MGGWGELHPSLFGILGIFFFAKPLSNVLLSQEKG